MNIKKLFGVLFITVMLLSVPCAYALDSDTVNVNEVQDDVKLSSSESEIEQVDNLMDKKVDSNKNSPLSSVKMNKFAEISINLGATVVEDIKVQNNPQIIKYLIKIKPHYDNSSGEVFNRISKSREKITYLIHSINSRGILFNFERLNEVENYLKLAEKNYKDAPNALIYVDVADEILDELYKELQIK